MNFYVKMISVGDSIKDQIISKINHDYMEVDLDADHVKVFLMLEIEVF